MSATKITVVRKTERATPEGLKKAAEGINVFRAVSDATFLEDRRSFRVANVFSQNIKEVETMVGNGKIMYKSKKASKKVKHKIYKDIGFYDNYSAEVFGLCFLLNNIISFLNFELSSLAGKQNLVIVSCDCAPALSFVDKVFYACFHGFRINTAKRIYNLNAHVKGFNSKWKTNQITIDTINYCINRIRETCENLKAFVISKKINLHLAFYHVHGHAFKGDEKLELYDSRFIGHDGSKFRIMSDQTPLNLFLNNFADVLANEKSDFGKLQEFARCSKLLPVRHDGKLLELVITRDKFVGLYRKVEWCHDFVVKSHDDIYVRQCSHYISLCGLSNAAFHFKIS